MIFHISDCRKFTRCPRLFMLDTFAPKREFQPFVRLDEEVSDLALRKLKAGDCFRGRRGDDPQDAMIAMESFDWLAKARFEYGGLRIKVPFMHRNGDVWDIWFLFIGLYPHLDDPMMYCATVWVLEQLGIRTGALHMIHLNAAYVRKDSLDPDEMFTVSDFLYTSTNNPGRNLRELVDEKMRDFSGLLKSMNGCLEGKMPEPVRTQKCMGRVRCRYYHECFPAEEEEADNSIVTLVAAQHKYEMKKEGLTSLKQADPERIEGLRMQYAQIIADRTKGLHADVMALRSWLDRISFPVTFLDFEWERFAIPPYKGMKPFDVLPFEYSVHIMDEHRNLTHQVYLSVHDDRRDMAEHLLKDIPENGTVIAYNAEGAEKIRIAELADLFPDLSEGLRSINSRMEDLQLPFESGTVYDTRMRGTWSLKTIMGLMDEAGYRELDISQGMDAVFEWRHLDMSDASDAEKEKIIEDLKQYCGMDTYAMTVVFAWLIDLADGSPW